MKWAIMNSLNISTCRSEIKKLHDVKTIEILTLLTSPVLIKCLKKILLALVTFFVLSEK